MPRSEITLRDLRDLQTEMRKTEFASEPRRNFLIGLCNQLYPMLDIELLKKACPQVISAKSDCGCSMGLKPIDYSFSCKP